MPADRERTIELIARALAAGKMDERWALTALRVLARPPVDSPAVTVAGVLDALDAEPAPELEGVREHLFQLRLKHARTWRAQRASGAAPHDEVARELSDLPLSTLRLVDAIPVPIPLGHVLGLLDDLALAQQSPATVALADTIDKQLRSSAADAPMPAALGAVVEAARRRLTSAPEGTRAALETLAGWAAERERAQHAAVEAALGGDPAEIGADVDDAVAVDGWRREWRRAAAGTERRTRLQDVLFAGRIERVIAGLADMGDEPAARRRAQLLLTLRVRKSEGWQWQDWRQWAESTRAALERAYQASFAEAMERPVETLLMAARMHGGPGPETRQPLEAWCDENVRRDPEGFIERWALLLSGEQVAAVRGARVVAPPTAPAAPVRPWRPEPPLPEARTEPTPPPTIPTAAPRLAPSARVRPPEPPEPPAREEPGPLDFFRSFVTENWYLVAGLAMIVAGSSLLAYFTWDKHWLLRYTIMPALLAAFTFGLARIGTFLERQKAADFRGSAALLRGAATLLLPLNFMTVALLSDDPRASPKALAVPVASFVYLSLFAGGLARWCNAVHQRLGRLLAPALLFLNALVLLGPMARAVSLDTPGLLHAVSVAGFYAGFLAAAAAIVHFVRAVLDGAMAKDRRVPWFFGATLLLTYVEVLAWVHAWLRDVPEPHTYAPLVVLSGGLLLDVERRFLALRSESGRLGGESFLGLGLVLIGLLMGAGDPHVRILVFALAGGVWLYQAAARAEVMQYVLGLALLGLSAASVGLLDAYPTAALPAIGAVVAIALGAVRTVSDRRGGEILSRAAVAVQNAALLLTAVVAVLVQWRERSEPLVTAGWLIGVAAAFAWRSHREQALRPLLTTMGLFALALPYLGCVDMRGFQLHGNSLAFGLAALSTVWLMFSLAHATPLVVRARSTVLWFYGALAVTAVILRVVIEGDRPLDLSATRVVLDLAGPLAMAAVLVVTAYLSRSLVPSTAAALIVVILFPELKVHVKMAYPWITWGSGLGSSLSALGLLLLAFWARRWPRLQSLDGGDLFLGTEPFPLRRTDPSLFTLPLLASSVFLCLKVDTYSFLRNLGWNGLPLKTAAALVVVGVTWTLFAAYLRRALPTHLGWLSALAGIHFLLPHAEADIGLQWTFVVFCVLLQGLVLLYAGLAAQYPWAADVLERPTRAVLVLGGMVLAAIVTVALWGGLGLERTHVLMLLLAVQMTAHALTTGQKRYGGLLFGLAWTTMLAALAPGDGILPARLSLDNALTPNLWLFLGLAFTLTALEAAPALRRRLEALLWAPLLAATTLTPLLALTVPIDAVSTRRLSLAQGLLTVALVLLLARLHACGPLAAAALPMAYVLLHDTALAALPVESRLILLFEPWRLALLALAAVGVYELGIAIHRRWPRALAGPHGYELLQHSAGPYLLAGSVMAALAAAHRTALDPPWRADWRGLVACYGAALAVGRVGWHRGAPVLALSSLLLALANVLVVWQHGGPVLRPYGLEGAHLLALGLAATLLMLRGLRATARRADVVATFGVAGEVAAGLILGVLCAHYLADPNVAEIAPLRFVISGGMALLAALYFRRAATLPDHGRALPAALCHALYHFGVTLALWCFALLVPWLRHPSTALFALGLPVFYFSARAEAASGRDDLEAVRYRTSAATLALLVLGLYAFRGALQMLAFPDAPIRTDHYHYNAPLVIAVGLVLLRLHGLGAHEWIAFYGGLALVVGSYFGVTALPGWSPFEARVRPAWAAVALSHVWAAATYQRSPLRSAVQAMARIEPARWLSLRHGWGLCVLAAVHLLGLLALLDPRTDSYACAPLLLGLASVLVHQGVLRGSRWYLLAAAVEVTAALHADFVTPSYLPRDHVMGVLLGAWALVLAVAQRRPETTGVSTAGAALGAMAFAHVVVHHGASSDAGLLGFTALVALALITPTRAAQPEGAGSWIAVALAFLAPTWLVFFGTSARFETRTFLLTLMAILATGTAALAYATYKPGWQHRPWLGATRLAHQVLSVAERHGATLRSAALFTSFLIALALQLAHYGRAWSTIDFVLFVVLQAAIVASWRHEGITRRSMAAHAAAQLAAAALVLLVRRQLVLSVGFWTAEYDVWLTLAASLVLTGAKSWLDERPREERLPAVAALLVLPVVALGWTLVNGLGTDTALLVIGVQSLLFAFLGKDDRESPYHVVSLFGFVAFVALVFWTKLHLRALPAYVIPAGVGVLILVQMFARRLDATTRNATRTVALLAMLGSVGYHALLDPRYPLAFHGLMLLLCLIAMAVGGLLRIRVYLILGFAGMMVDLLTLVARALIHLDRGPRMMALGALVLTAGVGLVASAVYYKTHRDRIFAWLESWRPRFARWE